MRAVGQANTRMGTPDPPLNSFGQLDFCLASLYHAWQLSDDPRPASNPCPCHLLPKYATWRPWTTPRGPLPQQLVWYFASTFFCGPGNISVCPAAHNSGLAMCACGSAHVRSITQHALTWTSLRPPSSPSRSTTRRRAFAANETVRHGCSGHTCLCPVRALGQQLLSLRIKGLPLTPPSTLSVTRAPLDGPSSFFLTSPRASALP